MVVNMGIKTAVDIIMFIEKYGKPVVVIKMGVTSFE